jgi:hypothetical protein
MRIPVAAISIFFLVTAWAAEDTPFSPVEPPADPVSHGRVLMVRDRRATELYKPRAEIAREMIEAGLIRFTAKDTVAEAWHSLVSTQEVLGIKVHSSPGPNSGTRPAVIAELLSSLLQSGYDPQKIIIWDRRRTDLQLAGYEELAARFRVGLAAAREEGYDADVAYTNNIIGRLVYGDLEFGSKGEFTGRKSHVTKLLTRKITKILNVTPLLNHNYAGVSGAMYTLAMASVDNALRFEESDRLATAIPEIYALPEIADRVALNIVDALICQYRGEERTLLHYSTPLNQIWFSNDPVALDTLGLQEIERQRPGDPLRKIGSKIYANAALMDLGTDDAKQIRVERLELPARR